MRVVAAGPACALCSWIAIAFSIAIIIVVVRHCGKVKRNNRTKPLQAHHHDLAGAVLLLDLLDRSQRRVHTALGREAVGFVIGRHEAGVGIRVRRAARGVLVCCLLGG